MADGDDVGVADEEMVVVLGLKDFRPNGAFSCKVRLKNREATVRGYGEFHLFSVLLPLLLLFLPLVLLLPLLFISLLLLLLCVQVIRYTTL